MADPAVEVPQYRGRLAKAKVANPPSQVLIQSDDGFPGVLEKFLAVDYNRMCNKALRVHE